MPLIHPADIIASASVDELKRLKGLRVLLVNMPLRESALPNCAPLGPALLAARLRQYQVDVTILDLNAYRISDEASRLRRLPHGRHLTFTEARQLLMRHIVHNGAPALIGFSGKITTLRWQQEMAKAVKHWWPEAMLVSGGGLATEFRDGLFSWIPQLDAIAHSEGDDVIVKIALDAQHRQRCGRGQASTVRMTYHGDRPRDLDALPLPAWDLLVRDVDGIPVLEQYLRNEIWGLRANNSSATPFRMTRSLNTVSSRGCPFACSFCFRGGQGERNYGTRSAESIVGEFRWLSDNWGVDFIASLDDNFMVRQDRIDALAEPLGKLCRDRGIRWGTHGRLDEAAMDGRVARMSEGGCVYVGFGAESASPAVLTAMNKGGQMLARGTTRIGGYYLPTTMVEGYRKTIEAGVHGNCTWIAGYPSETLDDLKHSIAFILWQRELVPNRDAVNARMFTATAYPGTELFRHPAVQKRLTEGFGVHFDRYGNPVCDKSLEDYVLSLDDADKVLTDHHGQPVYYGGMPLDQFLRVRELLDAGNLEAVLSL